uniref:C2H2-type domain-containing protein n=1 Tax=Timema monikensis TaxID=170555 RepID=A0A7R9HNX9_9NEOP|nr:unnamed protein product [Timema monikensis]
MPWEICELFLTAQPPLLPPMNFYPPGPTFSSTMVGFNPGSVPTLVPTLSLPAVTLDGKSMDVMAPSYQHTDPVTKAVLDNIMGKLPTKKIPVICRCDVCNLEFSGQVVLDTHLAGAKHAKKLKTDMELRFEDLTKLQIPDWILDPFSFEAVDKLDNSLQTEFLDLKYDCEVKIIFKQSSYELVWVKLIDTYPQLWGKTEPLLISFPSAYLVEKGFSSVVQLLTKQRNKLDICLKGDLLLNLTNIKPDIQPLTEIHQAQGSH